nr:MAG TPA: hypothetical protein [Caudoviricetes sp.]
MSKIQNRLRMSAFLYPCKAQVPLVLRPLREI